MRGEENMYFEKPGPENTLKTIELALEATKNDNVEYVVVASNTGETAALLAKKNGGIGKIVCVTHAYGFKEKGKNEMTTEIRRKLEEDDVLVFTSSHVLSGVERGISKKSQGMYPAEIMANTLRMLGQGVKVCVEISIMALDAGLVPYGEKIVAIGGSGTGADTAVVITPSHANEVFATKIHRVICKPQ